MNTSDKKVYTNSGNEDVANLIEGINLKILDIGCGSGSIAEKLHLMCFLTDGISFSVQEPNQAKNI